MQLHFSFCSQDLKYPTSTSQLIIMSSTTANFLAHVSQYDFTNVANGINQRISILKHRPSGYYNVSQSLKAISETPQDLEGSKSQVPSNPKEPTWSNWYKNDTARGLIKACESELGLASGESYFSLRTGPNQYRGTYVHRFLYDHILGWASPTYAMRISRILDEYHARERATLEEQAKRLHSTIEQKDDKIDSLEKKIDAQSRQIASILQATNTVIEQNTAISEQLEESNERLEESTERLDTVTERLDTAIDYLEEKSYTSTMNPVDEDKHHHFAATVKRKGARHTVKLISGQRDYIAKTVDRYVNEGYKILLQPFYNANGIDLRNNSVTEFRLFRTRVIAQVNAERKRLDDEFNAKLKREIRASKDKQRSYVIEKQRTPKLGLRDIPIKFNKTGVEYHTNPYISFDEVMRIVIDTNGATQLCPISLDEKEAP